MPRRAMGELQPLEQHDLALAPLGQVIGDAAADDAAADDDNAAPRGDAHDQDFRFQSEVIVGKPQDAMMTR